MSSVSVIVPAYNEEKNLNRCLSSLARQSLDDLEIIVVDDDSTDNSASIVKQYKRDYKNFIYVTKENGGASSARNFGLIYATGEYVAFLNANDYAQKNAYKDMYEKAKANNSDLVECDFYWKYEESEKADTGYRYTNTKEMLTKGRFMVWNKIIKKGIILNNKLAFPIGLEYGDIDFFYKLVPYINKVDFVEEPLVYYVQKENENIQAGKIRNAFKALNNVIDYYQQAGLFSNYESELEYVYIKTILCNLVKDISKINDKITRNLVFNEAWQTLNTKYPKWKNNAILKADNSLNGIKMKVLNNTTYKAYTKML